MHAAGLANHVNRLTTPLLAKLGHGGPALNNATFVARADNEANLPKVWTQLANCSKGSSIATVASCVGTRFLAANTGWAPNSIPIITTQLNNQVFKRLAMGGTGLQMGHGLSPFAVVCENHTKGQPASKASAAAETAVGGGTQFNLQDLCTIMTSDIRLPGTPHTAVEKLIGWSILVDMALGARHPCAVTTHNFALQAGPLLLQFSNGVMPINIAMEYILGTLFQVQQEFFLRLAQAKTATTAAA
jgi:hypothetical protein